jgi:hypothetical protein
MLEQPQQENMLDDGTGYHPVWSTGAISPAGVEAEGKRTYLPIWQRQ